MAPPRRILRQQLEILMDFLEENRDMSKGLLPGTPASQQRTRQKWASVAKKLNAVQSGALKTPDRWKRYWIEWRHKCRKKAANARRFQSKPDGGSNRLVPLNDLELRALELSGKPVAATAQSSNQLDDFLADDSDSEPLETIKVRALPQIKVRQSIASPPRSPIDDNMHSISPPPKWAIELEERRVAAEERIATALESITTIMRSQEERRALLEDRVADALTAIAGTVQDMNSGIQEALSHFQQILPLHTNGPDLKEDVFL